MTNNDILRRLRFIFDCNDTKMMEIFAHAEVNIARAQLSNWLKKDDDEEFVVMYDDELEIFLDGLIIEKRGKKDGPAPIPSKHLTNNIIFRKLRIALNYKDEDILAVLDSVDMRISKHELSAFFRNPNQSQYRNCNNQMLRNFLMGLQIKLNPKNKTGLSQ